MAGAASRTLLALLVAFGAAGSGWTAEKPPRPPSRKQPSVDRSLREPWESSIHLDGRPVDRFVISSGKPSRSHRFAKEGKDGKHLLEEVDPEWANLDGFAVLGVAPVTNSSAGPSRTPQTAVRYQPPARRATRVDRTVHASGGSSVRTLRRAPQSSSGPRQPERLWLGGRLLGRKRQHNTKPQSDQRNRNAHKLTSESVHVVSLQAQKTPGQSVPANRAVTTKTTTPGPPEYVAQDISVRVMSPQSVLISWVDPVVEMGKVEPGESRSYTVKFREKGESARWDFMESTQRRMMIDTLTADSMYEFSVRISQGDNQGKWSVSVFQRTPESAPSGPPENFEVKPLRGKGTAVIATWDPPEEPNGRIKEYVLSYAPAMKPFGMKSVTYRGSTTTATIDGLTPGDRYIFKIRASNRRGQGPQSKVFSVAMPGSSRTASSFSKTKDSHRTSHSKQDPNPDESALQSTEVQEEPTTSQPRPAAPVNRRVRPLTQTRSYHSIFSSIRGSVRNPVNRGSSRERAQDREDEEEEEEEVLTTPAPTTKTTTMEDVPETKEPDNDVAPGSDEEEPQTTETPSLKLLTPSPTKQPSRPSSPSRRPIKIRVHQKPASKASSTTSSPTTSSSTTTTPSSSLQIQESAASRKDYVASAYPEIKNPYNKPSISYTRPSTTDVRDRGSQQTSDRGSSPAGRTNGFRYGYSRRHPGILFRGNSTRMVNGYKPAIASPSRTQTQASTNTHSSGTSQSTLLDGSQNLKTSHAAKYQETSGPKKFDKLQYVSESKSQGSTVSMNTEEKGDGYTNTNAEATKVEEPTSSSKLHPHEVEKEEKQTTTEKPPVTRAKINPSFAKRFPWLASRYPGMFGSQSRVSSSSQDSRNVSTRTSSSVEASTPNIKGISTRLSGATGAAGVSKIQETSRDLRNPSTVDSLKNEDSKDSIKPSSDNRNPTTSSSSSSGSESHHYSRRQGYPIHRGTSHEDDNEYKKDNLDERSEKSEIKEVDPSSAQNKPSRTGTDRNEDNNESVDTFSRTRHSSPAGGTQPHLRPGAGANGRVRSPFQTSRHFGGSRFPIRPQPAQNSRLGSSTIPSSASSNVPQLVLTSDHNTGTGTTVTKTGGSSSSSSTSSSSLSTPVDSLRSQGGRSRSNIYKRKPTNGGLFNRYGKNGRYNLTSTIEKESPSPQGTSKNVGQKFITGPDGTKWLLDLERGLLMNQDGRVLQDSQGKPKRVVLGEDGRTIFDLMGSPLVNQDGMALFGHGRDSRPVVNPKDKLLMVGGKPLVGLDRPHSRTTTTTTTTTTTAPTTTPEPTTTDWIIEESTTVMPHPTCPPGTSHKTDEYGYPLMDLEGILDCYPDDETTLVPPTTTTTTTTTTATTTTEIPTPEPDTQPFNNSPLSEFDLSGKKRFTAPYVNYIQKDPGAPCSLTEALEFLQVDVIEDLMEKDMLAANQKQPPKNKPHNLTVVAMEGCHSFIILDWARPLKEDMVSGYMVYSASYDDVLNNRWSSRSSSGTQLAVENLKPNSRYYFKVQAKNVFGLGPISDTLSYVTESDDPLLIERPPGGEPIWVPFSFKYNPAHSSCKGSQYVKRTWYRKFVGVVLCNSLRYKIFMGDGLREPFYSIGDTFGLGEDHCQFVDSYRDGRTGPAYYSNILPSAQGYFRAYRQEPVTFGVIGRRTAHPFVGWYECGVPIPGKW
ncbi:fibronectin type III domain-containing protein 1 [Antennarius striatus]|uniref:fibronectin type III domain-containing protein 1 n=1 Tax=Antennarius striatus TaxID=241820 RepID=UPI0035B2BBBD